ncbi:MAG: cation diffusion facilitator family transporter [Solirubrobacteraceae bacterium]
MSVGTTGTRREGTAARLRSPIGLRHSAATRRAGRTAGHLRSVAVALAANVVVAVAKLAAGLLSGSSALLAEAVHSTADSINEVLLWVSMRRGVRPADAEHPLGYGGARFLWAFLAAISSFVIGGCMSIGLAIHSLLGGGDVDHFLVAWIVLTVAAVADGASLVQTVRQARREAALWNTSTLRYLRHTSDPTLRALAVEDAAALVGVTIAALGLLVHELGGPSSSDAIASLLIGILLAITAVGLARPLADLLIGRSLAPARLQKARSIIEHSPAIDHVLNLYAVHAAPQEAILTARVHPTAGRSGEQLAQLLDELDQRLRRELPEIGEVFIDITAHLRPTRMEAS